jgi:Domain of unknown function (DUF1772)
LAADLGAGIAWLMAALLIGVVVPFTFIVMMPTNHELLTQAGISTLPRHECC